MGDRGWVGYSGPAFSRELQSSGAEYVDIMASGVSVSELKRAGFVSSQDYDGLVIPNYFSPYVQKNIDISFSCKSFSSRDICSAFFRADSDQDRPN